MDNSVSSELIPEALSQALNDALKPALKTLNEEIYSAQLAAQLQEAMRKPLIEIQNNISKLAIHALEPIQEAIKQLSSQQSEYLKQIAQSLREIDWNTLSALEDNDEVPESVSQSVVEAIDRSAQQTDKNWTKSDFFALISLILMVFEFIFGSPNNWYENQIEHQDQEKLISAIQENTKSSQQLAETIDKFFLTLSNEAERIVQDSEITEDISEPNTAGNSPDQESNAPETNN